MPKGRALPAESGFLVITVHGQIILPHEGNTRVTPWGRSDSSTTIRAPIRSPSPRRRRRRRRSPRRTSSRTRPPPRLSARRRRRPRKMPAAGAAVTRTARTPSRPWWWSARGRRGASSARAGPRFARSRTSPAAS